MQVLISALVGLVVSTIVVVGGVTTLTAANNNAPDAQPPTAETPAYADQ